MTEKCCLGEYKVFCDTLEKLSDYTFIDRNKTKLIAITDNSSIPVDAILKHEIKNHNNTDCHIKWYELINTYGRIYTIIPTACDVAVSNYENGFLIQNSCDPSIFGTNSYCFGKLYANNVVQKNIEECKSIFELDGHIFTTEGQSSNCFDLFDCSRCNDESLSLFDSKGDIPNSIPDATIVDIKSPSIQEKEVIQNSFKVENLSENISKFISCSPESELSLKQKCESQNNPSSVRMPDGNIIIAYQKRKNDGMTGISLSIIKSTVNEAVYFYRNLSFGSLINDNDFSYGSGKFEFSDNVYIELDENNVPIKNLQLVFLSGPLQGKKFLITNINRNQINNRIVNTIYFDTAGDIPNFTDSNNINDIVFCILSSENEINTDFNTYIDIPQHTKNNIECPMANPSISIAGNNAMDDGSQNIFLTYQVFENNQWNIYLTQIRLNNNEYSSPVYSPPYEFIAPSVQYFGIPDNAELTYKITSINRLGNLLDPVCVLFDVYYNNIKIETCNVSPGTFIHPCGNIVENSVASIEITYQQAECSYLFNLSVGDEVTGLYPPSASDFPDGVSSLGDSCIISYSENVDSSNWCYKVSNCYQFYLNDNEYCPTPYISYNYKAEDLWVIKLDDEKFMTRVLYHLSTENNNRIIERDNPGYQATFIKNASIYVSYKGDLSDFWTNEKEKFNFTDNAPVALGETKGLTALPFDLELEKVFNIETVHINGNIENWLYFYNEGQINTVYPNIGFNPSERSEPILIAENSIRPIVKNNQRNNVFIVYENQENGLSQIEIIGTDDFYQNSITGAKTKRITKFYSQQDFQWKQRITDNGLNQLADIFVDNNDITHIVWQSNRDQRWEIYYANSYDLFNNVRLTEFDSKSVSPRILVEKSGSIYVVYQDNRFENYEIMLSYKNEERILPLLQQDAYLASIRDGYTHYTNTLPITIKNDIELIPTEGNLLGTKISSLPGNDDENYIFKINTNNAEKYDGCSPASEIKFIAGDRKGKLYGIDVDNNLSLIDSNNSEYSDIDCSSITTIGNLNLTSSFVGNVEIIDNFSGTGNANPLIWAQRRFFSFDPFPGSGGTSWFVVGVNAIQDSGSLTYGDAGPIIHQCGSNYGIISLNPIVSESVSLKTKIKWIDFGPENTSSPEIKFILKNKTTGDPIHYISLQQISCSGTDCNQDLHIVYSDGPDVTIENFVPFKNTWSDLRIDCTVSAGTIPGRKNILIKVYINDIEYYSHERTNLLDSDQGLGKYFGVGSYSYFLPDNPDFRTGTFLIDYIKLEEINPTAIDNSQLLSISCDHINRLWALIGDRLVNGLLNLRIAQIDISTGQIINDVTVINNVSERIGGLTVLNNGYFYLLSYENAEIILYQSSYPFINLNNLNFSFVKISNIPHNIKDISSDYQDKIFGIDNINNLYRIYPSSHVDLIGNLSQPETNDPYLESNPLGEISSIGYKFSGQYQNVGDAQFFHILIEFYENINMNGKPALSINSVDQLESFISTSEDAYFSSNGINIEPGYSTTVYFDASLNRIGAVNFNYPYGFKKNQTYFPKIFKMFGNYQSEIQDENNTSFSCWKCDKNSNNNIDDYGCSYSVQLDPGTYNFILELYGDANYAHKISEYNLSFGSIDLIYCEFNNVSAANLWKTEGLEISESGLFQFYPPLNSTSGIYCGINYFIKLKLCKSISCDDLIDFKSGEFFCECSSNIFNNHQKYTSERWFSSNFGKNDTRITDTSKNQINPSIQPRFLNTSVITFEEKETTSIKGGTFKHLPSLKHLSSGTTSWFDYDFNIKGKNHSLTTDFYDSVSLSYEKYSLDDELKSDSELPTSSIFYKNCNFNEEQLNDLIEKCDITDKENNIILKDDFLFDELVKKIIINNSDVMYYTYNASGKILPVVNKCDLLLQIWGTPECVAFRLRNENEDNWSSWCSYTPEISEFYTEKKWTISKGSGIKEICIQLMTYSGVTSQKCFPIIADYNQVIFETNMFEDADFSIPLPTFDQLFVASTKFNIETKTNNKEKTIYVELIPNVSIDSEFINFDVITQGTEDIYDILATKIISPNGQESYRGNFTIKIEDKITNIDGLAKILPKFPFSCLSEQFVVKQNTFVRDNLNQISKNHNVDDIDIDILSEYRQNFSGIIGTGITIRPNDDPYFIYGNPDFFLEVKPNIQQSIPKSE